ncbi:hypothetical protein P153DRAFT_435511 [Dothidotthia symphoricarpi CBS 119687]|uniref:Uncharacterized protein n=1 Tax=Dothidotthia symphoricarpi CBS 119687 TaxID=1392245 RepID=A0A6A5ZVU5_9PLEO|nr:uncharacterized protein P153DRAFT_435511 [Dothidotthia symphoricarpi CBS 119687]KAF2123862.1 hypothetical protein P153DRAFT_435511 [Dothidotthia symphoricarpi CBS 119687]
MSSHEKLKVHVSGPIRPTPLTPPPAATAIPPKPAVTDFTYEDYKRAGLNTSEQHNLIGQIRNETPQIERDMVDSWLLGKLAKQLEIAIFPTCKMMHIDPAAVKRMLDEQFRKAYGVEVEAEVMAKSGVENAGEEVGLDVDGNNVFDGVQEVDEEEVVERPSKKAKVAAPSEVQKAVKAYRARRKKARKGCVIATLHSKSASEKWDMLNGGR